MKEGEILSLSKEIAEFSINEEWRHLINKVSLSTVFYGEDKNLKAELRLKEMANISEGESFSFYSEPIDFGIIIQESE